MWVLYMLSFESSGARGLLDFLTLELSGGHVSKLACNRSVKRWVEIRRWSFRTRLALVSGWTLKVKAWFETAG